MGLWCGPPAAELTPVKDPQFQEGQFANRGVLLHSLIPCLPVDWRPYGCQWLGEREPPLNEQSLLRWGVGVGAPLQALSRLWGRRFPLLRRCLFSRNRACVALAVSSREKP